MTEFVVATAAVLAPLMLGLIYIAKYSDIKHQAIQASRFAAFQHVLDPTAANESTAVLTEETRARFFADASQLNAGKIGFQDKTTGMSTTGTLNPMWSEVNGTAMIANYSDVTVNLTQGSFDSVISAADSFAQANYSLDPGGLVQASIGVPVVNITHFAPLSNLNINIGATTVVAGEAWNAGGAGDVENHFTPAAVPARLATGVLKTLSAVLDPVFQALSGTDGPQWGCINADAVPKDHLSNYNKPAPCSD
jgi:hypothetical protein